MSMLRYLPMVMLLSFSCASFATTKDVQRGAPAATGSVKGLRPIGVVGDRKLGAASLYRPTGVVVDPLGNIFITDTGNDRVVKCDRDGRFLREAGGFGWGNGQFNRPAYIATDNGLNLYVVDAQNKRIQRLDQNLNFVSLIEIEPQEDFLGLGLPEGIAVTSSGEIFVSDMEEDCLVKLDGFSQYERSFGGFTESGGGLRDPKGLCVDWAGEIFVADSRNDRVVVFDSFGNRLRSIGQKVLQEPSGVAVGRNGLVYVANAGNNSLAVLDSEGHLLLEYKGTAPGLPTLSKPTDLKLDSEGRLLVVDSGNSRVVIFELVM